jgi:hypothetical protein
MSVSYGKLPYHQRLEHITSQPSYHAVDICGSSFHGLATTIQDKIQKGEIEQARQQLLKCILQRKTEMRKRINPDPAHNHAIEVVRNLLEKVVSLKSQPHYLDNLKNTLIRFNDGTFEVTINGEKIVQRTVVEIGGKKRRNTHKSRNTKRRNTRKRRNTKRRKY